MTLRSALLGCSALAFAALPAAAQTPKLPTGFQTRINPTTGNVEMQDGTAVNGGWVPIGSINPVTHLFVPWGQSLLAPLASPALTGTPTAPTAFPKDNSARIATTSYADATTAAEAGIARLAEQANAAAAAAAQATANTNAAAIAAQNLINVRAAPYGAKCDGVTDDTAAFQAAFAVLANGGMVYVPPASKCLVSANLSATLTAPGALVGAGPGTSEIDFTGATDGVSITVPDGGIYKSSGLSIVRAYTGSAYSNTGYAIKGVTGGNHVVLDTIELRDTGSRTRSWATGLALTNLGAPSLVDVRVPMPDGTGGSTGPTGISIAGTSSTVFATDAKLSAVLTQGGHIGLNIGAWVQGVFTTNSEMIGADWPIYWNAPGTGGELLALTNSHLNGVLGGAYLNGASQSQFSGNLVLRFNGGSGAWTAFQAVGSNNLVYVGNSVYGSGTGIETAFGLLATDGTGTQPNTVVGNSIARINGPGVTLSGTMGNTAVTGNSMNGVTGKPVSIVPCPTWAASTVYAVGQCVLNGLAQYTATAGGTSASSGGPTGTGSGIADGLVTWSYVGPNPTTTNTAFANNYNGQPDFTNDGVGNITENATNFLVGTVIPKTNYSTALGGGSNVFSQMWSQQYVLKSGAIGSSFTVDNGGNVVLNTAPTFSANAYKAGSTAGVSCSGVPTSSYAVTNGIVTHC